MLLSFSPMSRLTWTQASCQVGASEMFREDTPGDLSCINVELSRCLAVDETPTANELFTWVLSDEEQN